MRMRLCSYDQVSGMYVCMYVCMYDQVPGMYVCMYAKWAASVKQTSFTYKREERMSLSVYRRHLPPSLIDPSSLRKWRSFCAHSQIPEPIFEFCIGLFVSSPYLSITSMELHQVISIASSYRRNHWTKKSSEQPRFETGVDSFIIS